jgi:hypothetical protein
VQRVQAGRDEIPGEEELRGRRIRPGQAEIRAGKQVLVQVVVPFEELQPQERDAERRGERERPQEGAAIAGLHGTLADRVAGAAGHEQGRVEGADPELGVARRDIEPRRMVVPIGEKGEEQRAEEQHLAGQEQPHADGRGAGLVGRRGILHVAMGGEIRHGGRPVPAAGRRRAGRSPPAS